MPTPPDNEVLQMDGWPKGLNNRLRETESQSVSEGRFDLPSSPWLRGAVNVDLTQDGHPLRRRGFQNVSSGYMHSLWSDPTIPYGLVVKDGTLTLLWPSEEALLAVQPYNIMSYTAVNGEVFFSNGVERGRITRDGVLRVWGLPNPPAPVVAVTSDVGGLHPGTHHVALTYEDAYGEESGASPVVDVEVPQNGGMTLTVPMEADVARVNVYSTNANGTVYTQTHSVAPGAAVAIGNADIGIGRELETLNFRPPFASRIVRAYNGRIYGVRDEMVWFTEPLRYGLCRPSQGAYLYDDDITLLEPVTEGVFVGGSFGIFFLAGRDPYDVTQLAVSALPPIPRAVARVPGNWLELPVRDVPAWWTQGGGMQVGMPDGTVQEMTSDRLGIPQFRYGAMMVREHEGMRHVVSVLGRGGEVDRMAASDSVVTQVRRNCVKLN